MQFPCVAALVTTALLLTPHVECRRVTSEIDAIGSFDDVTNASSNNTQLRGKCYHGTQEEADKWASGRDDGCVKTCPGSLAKTACSVEDFFAGAVGVNYCSGVWLFGDEPLACRISYCQCNGESKRGIPMYYHSASPDEYNCYETWEECPGVNVQAIQMRSSMSSSDEADGWEEAPAIQMRSSTEAGDGAQSQAKPMHLNEADMKTISLNTQKATIHHIPPVVDAGSGKKEKKLTNAEKKAAKKAAVVMQIKTWAKANCDKPDVQYPAFISCCYNYCIKVTQEFGQMGTDCHEDCLTVLPARLKDHALARNK